MGRRERILDAALSAFTEKGFTAATVDDVRRRSGASVGSIYHHFGGKEELADALYAEALREYQRGFTAVLRRSRHAERGVKGLVRHHLRWVAANPDKARFLLRGRPRTQEIVELNREVFAATEQWLRWRVAAGELRELPLDIYHAILMGPAQEFCRHWLEGRTRSSVAQAERALAQAAWDALRTQGGS
jgi:AcrR family transcriptional regulator